MDTTRSHTSHAALMSLEAAAASARGGFACIFSSADEYETALISERRAQGRYATPYSRWPLVMLVGCTLTVAGTVLLLSRVAVHKGDAGAPQGAFPLVGLAKLQ